LYHPLETLILARSSRDRQALLWQTNLSREVLRFQRRRFGSCQAMLFFTVSRRIVPFDAWQRWP
jgi:hypothetical protein